MLQGEELCTMCPQNFTNFEDGSSECSIPMTPGTNLRMRYAVIVSFGVFLNGTSLDSIADKVSTAGVSASIWRLKLLRALSSSAKRVHRCRDEGCPVGNLWRPGARQSLWSLNASTIL